MTHCIKKNIMKLVQSSLCPFERVESESRQKNAASGGKRVKEEDPYGGSTDENTDTEADENYPIPELPGKPL